MFDLDSLIIDNKNINYYTLLKLSRNTYLQLHNIEKKWDKEYTNKDFYSTRRKDFFRT